MNIQTVERTFIDKLFALCDYYLSKNYFRNSRHIYDIHMIWNSGLLNKKVVSNIVDDVLADRQRFSNKNLSSKPGSKPKDILLEIVETGVFKTDFNEVTLQFIYDDDNTSYEESIKTLEEILNTSLLPEVVRNY